MLPTIKTETNASFQTSDSLKGVTPHTRDIPSPNAIGAQHTVGIAQINVPWVTLVLRPRSAHSSALRSQTSAAAGLLHQDRELHWQQPAEGPLCLKLGQQGYLAVLLKQQALQWVLGHRPAQLLAQAQPWGWGLLWVLQAWRARSQRRLLSWLASPRAVLTDRMRCCRRSEGGVTGLAMWYRSLP